MTTASGPWVFRFPRRAVGAELVARAGPVLPWLAPRLPLGVPDLRCQGAPAAEFPWPFLGYPELPGTPASALPAEVVPREPLVTALAGFLSALHAVDPAALRARGIVTAPWHRLARVDELARGTADRLRGTLEPDLEARVRRYLRDPAPPEVETEVPLHGDLRPEHVLVDPVARRVTGVIDWDDLTLGDPSIDLVLGLRWDLPGLFEDLLARYGGPVDAGLADRARFRAVRLGLVLVESGRDREEPALVAEALALLERVLPR